MHCGHVHVLIEYFQVEGMGCDTRSQILRELQIRESAAQLDLAQYGGRVDPAALLLPFSQPLHPRQIVARHRSLWIHICCPEPLRLVRAAFRHVC